MNKTDPLTPEEMQTAANQFFPLLKIVKEQMPEESSTEDTLKVMEHVAKLAQKLRSNKKEEAREALFGFNKKEDTE
tara:strand:- start:834 stop:1061 length:228 start_codon:yes stop_codon:yes gene_type:complete